MSPDEFQAAWKSQSDGMRVEIDSDRLRKEVQNAQKDFRSMINWRDARECVVALVMIPPWFLIGYALALPWTWYLTVVSLCWIVLFTFVDRRIHTWSAIDPRGTLVDSAEASLKEVEHQIWLLRNVIWWYLMPFTLSIGAFFIHTSVQVTGSWMLGPLMSAPMCVFLIVLYGFVYYLNKRAVRTQLEPRREEIRSLLDQLQEESTSPVRGNFPILSKIEATKNPGLRLIVAAFLFLVFLSIGLGGIYIAREYESEYPKLSPFSAVRWPDTLRPEVQINDEWSVLVSIDRLSAREIVEFSKETYGSLWQKRFEEDLVEVLTRMGHPPGDTVMLVLGDANTGETTLIEGVPMTYTNRQAIRDAAQERMQAEEQVERIATPAEHDDSRSESLATALEAIRSDSEYPALAAFVLQDGSIIEHATVGTRSTKDDSPVPDNAQWHLGSLTKAMTATLAGVLVEEGLLRWDSTIGDVLGDAAPEMHEGHRDTTLEMLLHHRGGIQPNINWYSAPQDRIECAAQVLAIAPEGERGRHEYSNGGYVIAGAMLEVVTGERWEDLMREKIFDPLEMTDSGFGAPSRPDSPWGHRDGFLQRTPMDPSRRGSDNALVLGPAGTVHSTMNDYAQFIAAHLKGARGEDGLLKAETFAALHTPTPNGTYAKGWIVGERSWAGGRTLMHNGSNTMWYAIVWLAPEKNMAFFAATNAAGDDAFEVIDGTIATLIRRHIDM